MNLGPDEFDLGWMGGTDSDMVRAGKRTKAPPSQRTPRASRRYKPVRILPASLATKKPGINIIYVGTYG